MRPRAPEPGDLFVLPETADFPVEWAVLDHRPGRLLAVPADTCPLAGSADVEVPRGEPGGPLVLRCRYGVWGDPARFDPNRRTGTLDPTAVDRALRKRAELDSGGLTASPLAYEADADPEYEDWTRDVLVPAHAAFPAAVERPEPVSDLRPRWTSFGNPYALAASLLLMVTLGLAGGFLWQRDRLSDLQTERQRAEEQLQRERERRAGELRKLQEDHRRDLQAREREAAENLERERRRIAELEKRLEATGRTRPLINSPWAYLNPHEPLRGEAEGLSLPPEADSLLLILSVPNFNSFPEYRLEIREKRTGKLIWQAAGLRKTGPVEVSLKLPRDFLRPGDYRLRLFGLKDGKSDPAGEYELRIAGE